VKEESSTSAALGKPLIYRHAPADSLGSIASDAAMKRSLAVANLYAERNVQKAAAWRPVIDLLRRDPAATEMARQVIRIQKQISDLIFDRPPLELDTPPITIGPTDTLFFPPYTHAQVGPRHGLFVRGSDSSANIADGTFEVDASTDGDYDGVFSAVVGLGFDLATSDAAGFLELRPLIDTDLHWQTFAPDALSSYVEGGVSLTVLDSTTQTPTQSPLTNPATFTLFSQPSNDTIYDEHLFVTGDQLSVTVNVMPQTPYQVWIHLYIIGNQSGQYVFASSQASATLGGTFRMLLARWDQLAP
jgi:hypothetical protein